MNHLPALQVIIPLLSAPLCLLLRWRTGAWLIALVATWATFAVSLILFRTVMLQGAITYDMGGWPAPWGINYHIDSLSAFLVLIVTGIGALTLAYAYRSVKREIRPESLRAFYALLLTCQAGLLGIAAILLGTLATVGYVRVRYRVLAIHPSLTVPDLRWRD